MHAADSLSQFLADLVPVPAAPRPILVGLEHEYQVLEGTDQRDFRAVIHGLDLGRPNLDPGDPNAYRLRSGAMVTCDGAEAELALPPALYEPGFASKIAAAAASEAAGLARRLPSKYRIEGCSTHISVSAPDSQTHDAAALYARSYAPAMMLMMDGPASPGLLVRPRPGRLELCGEFITGRGLAAALDFAVGSVTACLMATARRGRQRAPMPPTLAVHPEPARQRYGWYVDRAAFGPDLYREGRGAQLPLRWGGRTTAQRQLELSWASIQGVVAAGATSKELAHLQGLVAGVRPLPIEAPEPAPLRGPAPPDCPSAPLLGTLHRPELELAPVMITWGLAVLLVSQRGTGRTAFLCLPSNSRAPFLTELRAGRLDDVLIRYLALRSAHRRLGHPSQALKVGLFDTLGPRRQLLATEPASDQRSPLERATGWLHLPRRRPDRPPHQADEAPSAVLATR